MNHKRKKKQFLHTNKRQFEKQISTHSTVAENIHHIASKVDAAKGDAPPSTIPRRAYGFNPRKYRLRYKISKTKRDFFNLTTFLEINAGNRAMEVSLAFTPSISRGSLHPELFPPVDRPRHALPGRKLRIR